MRKQIGEAGSVAESKKHHPKLLPDDEAQSKRFIEDAKQLGLDETGKLFEKAIGAVTSTTTKTDTSRSNENK